jgi:hypothetical protein
MLEIGWVQTRTTLQTSGTGLEEFHTLSILEDRGEAWLVRGSLASRLLRNRNVELEEEQFELQKDDPAIVVARIGNGPLIRKEGTPAA